MEEEIDHYAWSQFCSIFSKIILSATGLTIKILFLLISSLNYLISTDIFSKWYGIFSLFMTMADMIVKRFKNNMKKNFRQLWRRKRFSSLRGARKFRGDVLGASRNYLGHPRRRPAPFGGGGRGLPWLGNDNFRKS